MSRQKKDWAIKTRVDKLFDQITFRSNVVYFYLSVSLYSHVCDMCIKDWFYWKFFLRPMSSFLVLHNLKEM